MKIIFMIKNSLFIFLSMLSISIHAFELQSGDVILMSFNCYECRIIESETDSTFSHSGVIIKNAENSLNVLQSLGRVISVSLAEFLKNKRPQTKVSVYRPVQFKKFNKYDYELLTNEMNSVFNADFQGLKFDSRYLWNNIDENGNELLYCSEFVAKFLDRFLSNETIPFPLSYKKNYQYWYKYFNGDVPEGVLGNSPASLAADSRFQFLLDL